MSTPPKRAYVSEQSDAGIGIEEVQKLVSKMNFVSDRNTTATTSSSKKQQNIDEVVLISTTNETRARLEQLIKDIESYCSQLQKYSDKLFFKFAHLLQFTTDYLL